ncbi:MAG: heme-binding protein, partial [Stellaceae bacterium]
IQEHFDPGVRNTPGGPLFGVQFSQLSCSDFNTVASTIPGGTNAGPHRSPLGFSADSGGLPLYKNGVLAGGIGVMSKNTYSFDANILDIDDDDDEVIAIAGATGYDPPPQITADNIAINGISLRYTDATSANLAVPVAAVGSFTPLAVSNYFAGPTAGHTAIAGLTYGSTDGLSGVAPDGTFGPVLYPGTSTPAYVFTDGAGTVLDTPTAGTAPAGTAITAAEAQALITSSLNVAYQTRAAIRIPTNSFAQVTVTIVDLDGNVLAQARTPDAPIFGADVSRQKARTAVFFSRTDAAAKISGITATSPSTSDGTFANYITRSQTLVGPTVFSDGIAWSEVALGDIARPFYPDGIDADPPGSLSLPFPNWSVFSTGLQVDLVARDILNGTANPPPSQGCAYNSGTELPLNSKGKTQLANGMQIFSGSAPIYRGNILVGGIGVSGDGIQQDSLISYLGAQNGPPTLNNAPAAIRADQLAPDGVHLRYVNCPAAPFINSSVQNPC